MSADNWDKCPRCLADPSVEDKVTFREDYEIYGADEGTLHVYYSGRCAVCGLELKFHDVRRFWPQRKAA